VQPPKEEAINRAYQVFSEKFGGVEYLIGYEGNAFAFTGDAEQDILGITAVHPMREDAVREFLAKAKTDWSVVEKLVTQGQLIRTGYEGRYFYMKASGP
jgi:wyosine [tRNA(Phe)-imidazoG37] synthetase (radical SAM superfamily)